MTDTTAERGYQNPFERLFRVQHGEWVAFDLAFTYFFFLLGSYFMLRPLRGTVASNNAEVLHLLYTATFVCMLLIVPVFGWLVSRFRRGVFVPASYLFFITQLGFFAWAFSGDATSAWVQRAFYVWLSVFNLFVVSVFWSFMTDVFRPGQARRLFPTIMAGGSIGAIVGPLATRGLVADVGASGIMMVALAGLLVATGMAVVMGRYERATGHDEGGEVIGGGVLEGAIEVFRSKYLLLICLLMLTHNLTATFLYNGLAVLVDREIVGFAERTEFFAVVDLVVQVLAFAFQFFLTSRLVDALGMRRAIIVPPVLLASGFVILGSSMGLVLFAAVQVAQRSLNYGMLGPVKEMLFTVVGREQRYKSKNFIDTVVYRGSDVTASWLFKGMTTAGLGITQITWLYLPVLAAWGTGAWFLGRHYQARVGQSAEGPSESRENDG
ncbi:MFS transporter [Marinihelvus fidelis]|uniref:MFS transporter n=1 Tax=Marinihelvus fidelis TaxID=2613842 RepID=A0A5N0T8E5_9GAMM|nr:MFS transporter [Marinihelvus fidelis]KAA9129579.1 MFS transporter [Marinihelvus fidelis]